MAKKELKLHAVVSPTETVIVSAFDENGKAEACTLAFYMVSSHIPPCVTIRKNGEWAIIHRCKICRALSSNRIAADDNPMKLMSLAMKPISSPPFPLERIEELTR